MFYLIALQVAFMPPTLANPPSATWLADLLLERQQVPFTMQIRPQDDGMKCAGPGPGSPSTIRLIIDSDTPFAITSVTFQPSGIDEVEDSISLHGLTVDGEFMGYGSGNLTQKGVPTPNDPIEILSAPVGHTVGAEHTIYSPHELASNGSPVDDSDIEVTMTCRAGTTSDITFRHIQIGGWKENSQQLRMTYEGPLL